LNFLPAVDYSFFRSAYTSICTTIDIQEFL
jgi:hypothetical protein